MLIRPKGGVGAEERFHNFLQNGIFERLRSSYPERLKKIAYFPGNIEDDNFGKTSKWRVKMSENHFSVNKSIPTGLNELDRLKLCAQVNIIFHSAATVS